MIIKRMKTIMIIKMMMKSITRTSSNAYVANVTTKATDSSAANAIASSVASPVAVHAVKCSASY